MSDGEERVAERRAFGARRSRSVLARAAEEPSAFGIFYERYAREVLGFFTRRVLDAQVAFDLTAETFAVALEQCGAFRGSTPEEERGWLYAIARTQLSRYWRDGSVERRALRRIGVEPVQLSNSETDRVEELAGLQEVAGRLNGELAGLPPDQQTAIVLRVVEELDYPTVAARLGVSEDAARARVSRGLRALARALDESTLEEQP